MATRGSKRSHRDDDGAASTQGRTAVVVVVPSSGASAKATANTTTTWEAKLEQLAKHLESSSSASLMPTAGREGSRDDRDSSASDLVPFGSVYSNIQRWKENDATAWDGRMAALSEASHEMRAQVEKELQLLTAALHERSEQNYRHQLRITELRAAHRMAVQCLEEDLQSESSQRKHELSQLESDLDQIQKDARQVLREQGEIIPRLQHVVALYASCTGIKWYDDDDAGNDDDDSAERRSEAAAMTPNYKSDKAPAQRVWRGEVAVPALHQLQEFTFDAAHRFASANALWRTIGGQSQ